MYSLGLDIGSSSVKIALWDITGKSKPVVVRAPETEMTIDSLFPSWAEQNADDWWKYCIDGIQLVLKKSGTDPLHIKSIGISYQMHGLVAIDAGGRPVRPAIIWCDSRAVESGNQLAGQLDEDVIKNNLLNMPGNFTAAKLKWVIDHEPAIFDRIYKVMLPGDYISYKMTGEVTSTYAGMSEGIFLDFTNHSISAAMLQALGTDKSIIPALGDSFDVSAVTDKSFEQITGIKEGTPVSYRAGDQPNNAFALGVLKKGEAAATAGTSGVVYSVSNQVAFDPQSRVNTFAHVNHNKVNTSLGTLLCINGAGILYSWLRQNFFSDKQYHELEAIAASVYNEGINFMPFGNGAERMLFNGSVGSGITGINFNIHDTRHILRAGLEGIAFAFAYGMEVLNELGVRPDRVKVGNDNLFQSGVFSQTLSDTAGVEIKMYETTGAIGAAMGAAYGAGLADDLNCLHNDLKLIRDFTPENNPYVRDNYERWKNELIKQMQYAQI